MGLANRLHLIAAIGLMTFAVTFAEEQQKTRDGKVLPIFSVVTFKNALCAGTSRNGTCYTTSECSNKGGSESGSCAEGFGVCCVFELGCGDSASENGSYIVQAATTDPTTPCTMTICPCSTNICRIRLDFSTFIIAGPQVGTSDGDSVVTSSAVGHCVTDQFSLSAPNRGTPTICGTNTGYHMIVDADEACHKALFTTGGGTTSRQWDIWVTQYNCGDEEFSRAGPMGCLQYHTGTTGLIQSFNFPTTIAAVTAATTHLANQYYDICIRREANYCYICYIPIYGTPAIGDQGTFGLGLSVDTAAQAGDDSDCIADYIEFPNGAVSPGTLTIVETVKLCGRYFHSTRTTVGYSTICTRSTPFRVGVAFDGIEDVTATANIINANVNEQGAFPGGIIGFRLVYTQNTC